MASLADKLNKQNERLKNKLGAEKTAAGEVLAVPTREPESGSPGST